MELTVEYDIAYSPIDEPRWTIEAETPERVFIQNVTRTADGMRLDYVTIWENGADRES